MNTPICGVDGAVMTCTHTGRRVLTHSEGNLPHQLWSGDEYTCPACNAKVVVIANSTAPIAEHWEPKFAVALAQATRSRGGVLDAYYGMPPGRKDPPMPPALDAPPAEAQTATAHAADVPIQTPPTRAK